MFGWFTTMTLAGVYGPRWYCDDYDEAEALAEEHGFVVLDAYMQDEGEWTMVVEG